VTAVLAPPFAPDLEALLVPIPGDDPAGVSLRYEGTYDRVREARRADDPSLPQGVWAHELKRADWPGAAELCREALAARSKDLQLAAWLTEAWTGEHGFAGAAAGLAALLGLCEQYWDGAWPRGDDPEETIDARARVFEWLDGRLVDLLGQTPLTRPDIADAGTFTWVDRESALRLENTARRDAAGAKDAAAKGAVTMARFDRAVALTPAPFHAARAEALTRAYDAASRLQTLLDGRCGAGAPGLLRLSALLANLRRWTQGVLPAPAVEETPAPEPAMPPTPENAASAAAAEPAQADDAPAVVRVAVAPAGRPTSREEAYRWLATASDYLAAAEPHSPVAYLVRRALAWGRLSLPELTLELMKQGYDLATLRALLGFEEGDNPVPPPPGR
jgi:type VI secretion system protein ImpA